MKAIKETKQFHILVVEDNLGDYTLIEDYLEDRFESPKISWAKNFQRAESMITNDLAPCDLVLLDLTLPDKSGEDLITAMSQFCHEIPLIILTGYTDNEFALKSLALGVSDYLIKDELDAKILHKSILYNLERKKSQLQLEHSERRYSDLFHLSPLPMWVYDMNTLRFLDVNKAAEIHYGYTLQEFLGMTIKDIRAEEDVPNLLEVIETVKELKGSHYGGFWKHQKKNGDIIQVEIQSNTIQIQGTVGRIVLINDVSEQLKYIAAIEQQNVKLKDIAWVQSHVVRAPLARMMSLIDVIKNYGLDDAESEKLFEHVLTSANELDNIIREISKKAEGITFDGNP